MGQVGRDVIDRRIATRWSGRAKRGALLDVVSLERTGETFMNKVFRGV